MQNNGTTLQHSLHNLAVYKVDNKKYDIETHLTYLNLPSRTDELIGNAKPSVVGLSLLSKDAFTIETNLCSTKLTQDGKSDFFWKICNC